MNTRRTMNTRLLTPAEDVDEIQPPTTTQPHELPFSELSWQNFQKLCVQLAMQDADVEHAQEYGVEGQDQEGIDLFVRLRSGDYETWQCKRYCNFTSSDAINAVKQFLDGNWAKKTKVFRLCVTTAIERKPLAEEIERQNTLLREHKISFIPQGVIQLSNELRKYPKLVDSFFGRPWAVYFCGESAAKFLDSRKLTPQELARLRRLLYEAYTNFFRGSQLPLPTPSDRSQPIRRIVSLRDTYVVPDVVVERPHSDGKSPSHYPEHESADQDEMIRGPYSGNDTAVRHRPMDYEGDSLSGRRRQVFEWIVENERSIVIGDPGLGKSALLRSIALDLLSETPQQLPLTEKWGGLTPIWIPFSLYCEACERQQPLTDAFCGWLRQIGRDDVIPMVEKVFEDERTLVLVDGMDEWTDQVRARQARLLLHTFVLNRHLKAVATSRPLGYQQIGGLGGDWNEARLAELDMHQQEEILTKWLTFADASSEQAPTVDDPIFRHRARSLLARARHDSAVAQLTSQPLMLWGIMALESQGRELPRNRCRAYQTLTEVLLGEHHSARLDASLVSRGAPPLSPRNARAALAHLAYHLHISLNPNEIEQTVAVQVLRHYFIEALGISDGEARILAEGITSAGVGDYGILTAKSQTYIGFLHRAFQETLVATYLEGLPFDEQRELVNLHCGEHQWQVPIVLLVTTKARRDECDDLLLTIRDSALRPHQEAARSLLLSEIGFGESAISPNLARQLTRYSIEIVESGAWRPLRRRILDHVMTGLHSETVGTIVEDRLRSWFPGRHRNPEYIYEAMLEWPDEEETRSALWCGLTKTELRARLAAGNSLLRISKAEEHVQKQLIGAIAEPRDPKVAATILTTLVSGWLDREETQECCRWAFKLTDPDLKFVGLVGMCRSGERSDETKSSLLEFAMQRMSISWEWSNEILNTLTNIWPSDDDIRRICIDGLKDDHYRNEPTATEHFYWPYLLKSFPQDDEVASLVSDTISGEHSFVPDGIWNLLADHYPRHPLLVPSVEKRFLEKQFLQIPELYAAPKIARTEAVKKKLIEAIAQRKETFIHHHAQALLDVWGMGDQEVATALQQAVDDRETCDRISFLLPRIIPNREECRRRLLKLLESESLSRSDFVIIGLGELSQENRDEEAAQAIIKYALSGESYQCERALAFAAEGFRWHGGIKERAVEKLLRQHKNVSLIAHCYADDDQIRREVIASVGFLPSDLRLPITQRLRSIATVDDHALVALSRYDEDEDPQCKVTAAVGYYEALRDRETSVDHSVRRLAEDLHATGPDYHERRQAAIVGLCVFGRFDILAEAKDRYNNEPLKIPLYSYPENPAFAELLIANWASLVGSLGEELWSRLGSEGSRLLDIDPSVGYGGVLEAIIQQKIEPPKDQYDHPLKPRFLRALARVKRAEQRYAFESLLRRIVFQSRRMDWGSAAETVTAAEIMAEKFGTNEALERELIESLSKRRDVFEYYDGLFIALAAGWNHSNGLREFLAALDRDTFNAIYNKLLTPTRLYITCAYAPASFVIEALEHELGNMTDSIWNFASNCVNPIVIRLREEEELSRRVQERLGSTEASSFKTTMPRLLQMAGNYTEELREWCEGEYRRQLKMRPIPEVGMDLRAGRIRPVAHALLEVLAPLP